VNDKDMVNDVLSMLKSSLTNYERVISECANQQLRSTIRQIRDSDEDFQYRLFKAAEQKGFYKPAQPASSQDISQVRSQVMM